MAASLCWPSDQTLLTILRDISNDTVKEQRPMRHGTEWPHLIHAVVPWVTQWPDEYRHNITDPVTAISTPENPLGERLVVYLLLASRSPNVHLEWQQIKRRTRS